MTLKTITFVMLLLFQLSTPTLSINIECTYSSGQWDHAGYVYKCIVDNNLNIKSQQTTLIDSSSGWHRRGNNNNDVTALHADNSAIWYFPKGLDKVFPSLKVIAIQYGRIREIHQTDLRPFTELTFLGLGQNNIQILEKDLFEHNSKLTFVNFYNNRIIHVDVNVFDNLNSLVYLYLNSNTCIDKYAFNDEATVKEIISLTRTGCQYSEYSTIENDLKQLEANLNSSDSMTFHDFSQKLDQVQDLLKSSRFVNFFEHRLPKLIEWKLKNIPAVKNDADSNEILKNIQEMKASVDDLKNESDIIKSFSNAEFSVINDKILNIEKAINSIDTKIENLEKIMKDFITRNNEMIRNLQKELNEKL